MRNHIGKHHPGGVRWKLEAVLGAVPLVLSVELQVIVKAQHEAIISGALRHREPRRAQKAAEYRSIGLAGNLWQPRVHRILPRQRLERGRRHPNPRPAWSYIPEDW